MSSRALNTDGVRFFQQGNTNAAIQRFQEALSSNPYDPDAYYNLASTYHHAAKQTGNDALMRQAEGIYLQCLDRNPNHVDCHRALAVLLVDTKRPDSAFTLLERWVARSPQMSDARIELARLYEEFGEERTAQRFLNEALGIDNRNARGWAAMARLHERQGDYAQALSNYRQAYQLNNYQPGVANRIAALQNSSSAGRLSDLRPRQLSDQGWTQR